MKLAVVGSRDYPNLDQVRQFIGALPTDTLVISGGARGVDRVASDEAHARGLTVRVLYPDWEKGRGAGFLRNSAIVEQADAVVAFWDGQSRGTLDTIRKAQEAGKLVSAVGPGYTNIEALVPQLAHVRVIVVPPVGTAAKVGTGVGTDSDEKAK